MATPLYTIGIPTYNRVGFLRESLNAARSQSYENLQIVVSDNASNDGTEAYVKSLNDPRVKYHRNSTNIGAYKNFELTVDLADGEYFSWLQDDDLIGTHFARRAVHLMTTTGAAAYLSGALNSPDQYFLSGYAWYAPPVRMDWLDSKPSVIDAQSLSFLSHLSSVAIPPVVAFSRAALAQSVSLRDNNFPLFAERTILCECAKRGGAIADPVLSGIFRYHPNQASLTWCRERGRYKAEWCQMAKFLGELGCDFELGNLEVALDCLRFSHPSTLEAWLRQSHFWPADFAAAQKVRNILISVANERGLYSANFGRWMHVIDKMVDRMAPPSSLHWVRKCMRMICYPRRRL